MATRIAIFQMVAQHLGQDQSLVDPAETLPLAGLIASVWDMERRAALRANAWNFSIKRASISPQATVPAFGYSAQFAPPNDCVRVIDLVGLGDRGRDWSYEGGLILANATTVYLIYVADNNNPETWDDAFADAFSLKIAERIALNVTGDENQRQALAEQYKAALAEAQATDGQENPPISFDEDVWVMGRWGAGGDDWGGYHPPLS